MQLGKFFKVMGFVVVLALSYIHMQMQMVDLAYKGSRKDVKIKKLIEDNGNTNYKILMLKSANHLGVAMLSEDSDMQFADARDIIQIAASQDILMDESSQIRTQLAQQTNPLLKFLSFGAEAEARTSQ